MVVHVSECDSDRLKLLLNEQLSDVEQVAIAEHLEGCQTCRSALETLAATQEWWSDASALLGTDDKTSREAGRSAACETGMDSDDLIVSPLSTVESSIGNVSLDFLEPSDSPAMLGKLGDYDIIEPIGCGGMGIVLKGYDPRLNRFVAVKVLAPHYATSAAARKRFAREAQAAAAVVHPHVLAIHSVDATGRLPFLVMPFVDGESLQERIRRTGQLGVREVLRIGIQAARGLAAAHEQGLVHRDIKPGNILLERDVDRAMLTDFGLARAVDDASMTRSGVIAGTPQFMSPEQACGEAVDHRSDLFSLGSVLYTMCAGRPPFRAETTMGLLRRIIDTEARPLQEINADIPDWLSTIIEKLHSKQADDRFASASELADLLEGCLAHVQQPAITPLPESLQRSSVTLNRRRRSVLAVAAILASASVLALTIAQSEIGSSSVLPDSTSNPAELIGTLDVRNDLAAAPITHGRVPDESVEGGLASDEMAWKSGFDDQIDDLLRQLDALERDLFIDSESTEYRVTPSALDQEGPVRKSPDQE